MSSHCFTGLTTGKCIHISSAKWDQRVSVQKENGAKTGHQLFQAQESNLRPAFFEHGAPVHWVSKGDSGCTRKPQDSLTDCASYISGLIPDTVSTRNTERARCAQVQLSMWERGTTPACLPVSIHNNKKQWIALLNGLNAVPAVLFEIFIT